MKNKILASMKTLPSQEYLQHRFTYDGIGLIWKNTSYNKTRLLGKYAAKFRHYGTRLPGKTVSLDHVLYLEHRLIFKHVYGYDPVELDHINRIGYDNRIENLREVTSSQNQRNRSDTVYHDMPPGVAPKKTGYYAYAWQSELRKTKHLGVFQTVEEASEAVVAFKASRQNGV